MDNMPPSKIHLPLRIVRKITAHSINGYILALLGKVEVYLASLNGEEREKL